MIEKQTSKEFIRWFSKINRTLVDLVGEKGANLGELFVRKLPVPNGFVVTTESYLDFLNGSKLKEKIGALFEEINLNNFEEIENACKKAREFMSKAEFSEKLKEEILDSYETLGTNKLEIEKGSALDILNNASEPIFVSVRGSLPFEKVLDLKIREQNTYLNVKGNDSLLSHIKNCFISLFNPETVKREFLRGRLYDNFKIAVIVQKMVSAEKSGSVCSGDSSGNILIRAIWGLGEGKSMKEVIPDKYLLSKELEILDKKIGNKSFMVIRDSSGVLKSVASSDERKFSQVLNNYEIQRLGDFAEKIESYFGNPQKIEFSIDESGIYILQSRDLKNILKGGEFEEKLEEKVDEKNFSVQKNFSENFKFEKSEKIGKIEKVDKATKTKLKLVLDSPYLVEEGEKSALKKVGILKIEEVIKKSGKHPLYFLESHSIDKYENLVYEGIKEVAKNFNEVWIRTIDFLSNDFLNLKGAKEKEENPLLGLHGIRFSLKYLNTLEAELRAIKRISKDTSVGVLIPNLISIDELKKVKELLKNLEFENVRLGILIETPAAIQLIKDFCEEKIDSIVINTDRLMQYLLVADESNLNVKNLIDYSHPSFIYQLEYLIRVSKRNGIKTNIFGKAINDDEILETLIKKGIDFVFVKPENAKIISDKILSIEDRLLKGTDLEPRRYELEKVREDYLKKEVKKESENEPKITEEKREEEINIIENKEKLEKDLELIEKEKKESFSESQDGEHKELKENSDEKFDEGIEKVEEIPSEEENKDVLGIF